MAGGGPLGAADVAADGDAALDGDAAVEGVLPPPVEQALSSTSIDAPRASQRGIRMGFSSFAPSARAGKSVGGL
jgi:hypothetical protein